MPQRYSQSNSYGAYGASGNAKSNGRCPGVTNEWTQCNSRAAHEGQFCYEHESQSRWASSAAMRIPVEDFKDHATKGTCCGLIKGDLRLCNNRIGGHYGVYLDYCWRHGGHRFPSGYLPEDVNDSSLFNINESTKHRVLKERFLKIKRSLEQRQDTRKSGAQSRSTPRSSTANGGSYNQRTYTHDQQDGPGPEEEHRRSAPHASSATSSSSNQRSRTKPRQNPVFEEDGIRHFMEELWRKEKERQERERNRREEERRRQEQRAREKAREEQESARREERRQQEEQRRKTQTNWGSPYEQFSCDSSFTSSRIPRWAPGDALREYQKKAATYDAIKKFGDKKQASFSMIPWPVLTHPKFIQVSTINWVAVEEFFDSIRIPSERRSLLTEAMRRFHPDRAAGRGLFQSIPDEARRQAVKNCLHVVSQAVNGLAATS